MKFPKRLGRPYKSTFTDEVAGNYSIYRSIYRIFDLKNVVKGSKHTRDDDDDDDDIFPETSKKTRVQEEANEAEEDDEMDWEISSKVRHQSRKVSDPKGLRGHKRQAGVDDDEFDQSEKKEREKRARKGPRGNKLPFSDGAPGSSGNFHDLISSHRGIKRNRFEAGSTFGGDDDLLLVNGKKSRRRQHRSGKEDDESLVLAKRTSNLSSTAEDDDTAIMNQRLQTGKIKKKGKQRADFTGEELSSDISMSEDRLMADTFCRGHNIGEEWEVNGQKWKVGQDGRRLRLALLNRKRSRYSMVLNSYHITCIYLYIYVVTASRF